MAGLGADLREVYDELGAITHIVNRTPVVTTERILYDLNAQVTKPFIREHFLDATLPYNTLITTDDVIYIVSTDKHYLVMNKTPELFEDGIVEWNAVLYSCNLVSTACILRPVEVRVGYNMTASWSIVAEAPLYGLMSDRLFGSEIDQHTPSVGQEAVWRIDLYLPKYYDIKPLDRVYLTDNEYYKVESVQEYNYPGVCVVLLVEDTRPFVSVPLEEDYEEEY